MHFLAQATGSFTTAVPYMTVSALLTDRTVATNSAAAGPASLQIGDGNAWNGEGNVNITNSNNSFTGPITVTGGYAEYNGGFTGGQQGYLQSPAAGTPLGSTNGSVTLQNAQWAVNGVNNASAAMTKGVLTVDGGNTVVVNA